VKQVSTTIPVIIIVFQVIYHRNDKWQDTSVEKYKDDSKPNEKR